MMMMSIQIRIARNGRREGAMHRKEGGERGRRKREEKEGEGSVGKVIWYKLRRR